MIYYKNKKKSFNWVFFKFTTRMLIISRCASPSMISLSLFVSRVALVQARLVIVSYHTWLVTCLCLYCAHARAMPIFVSFSCHSRAYQLSCKNVFVFDFMLLLSLLVPVFNVMLFLCLIMLV